MTSLAASATLVAGLGLAAPQFADAGQIGSTTTIPQTMGCCDDGTCLDVTVSECDQFGGTAFIDGSCSSAPTDTCLYRACCLPGGGCVDTDAVDCASQGGSAEQPGTSCTGTSGICQAPPTGACCTGQISNKRVPTGCFQTDDFTCDVEFGGIYQGDGTNCDTPGVCLPGSTTSSTLPTTTTTSTTTSTTTTTTLAAVCGDGVIDAPEECDDANTATGDGCDDACTVEECWTCGPVLDKRGAASVCTPLDGVACDDGNLCTVGEMCATGVCQGGADVVFGAACEWFAVGESDTGSDVNFKEGRNTFVTGDICLDKARVGLETELVGDLVVTQPNGAKGIKIAPDVIIAGDVVTGGAGVKGIQGANLPHITPATNAVAGGNVVAKDNGGEYSTDGSSTRLTDCGNAMTAIDSAKTALDAQSVDQSFGKVKVKAGSPLTITPGNDGGINVVRYERLLGGVGSIINVDGTGLANPATTVVIIRVDGKTAIRANSSINLLGGLLPQNFILYGRGKKVQLGSFNTMSGTIYSLGKANVLNGSTVQGQVFARKGKIKFGDEFTGTTSPNLIVLP